MGYVTPTWGLTEGCWPRILLAIPFTRVLSRPDAARYRILARPDWSSCATRRDVIEGCTVPPARSLSHTRSALTCKWRCAGEQPTTCEGPAPTVCSRFGRAWARDEFPYRLRGGKCGGTSACIAATTTCNGLGTPCWALLMPSRVWTNGHRLHACERPYLLRLLRQRPALDVAVAGFAEADLAKSVRTHFHLQELILATHAALSAAAGEDQVGLREPLPPIPHVTWSCGLRRQRRLD